MYPIGLFFLLAASIGFYGCGKTHVSPPVPMKWTTGFWFWNGSSASVNAGVPLLDTLFVHVGSIRRDRYGPAQPHWTAYGNLPAHLPPAREYWLVFRSETPEVPPPEAALELMHAISRMQEEEKPHPLKVTGIQLDIDSPTSALPQYAQFLHEFRKALPTDQQISITALLDWFRTGTEISKVLQEVDEFVPQFYDVQANDRYSGGSAIAAPFTAAKWGPVFNHYQKRFRIGISTFGRSWLVPSGTSRTTEYLGISVSGDLKPLDFSQNPDFVLQTSRTKAGETVLNYHAARETRISYNRFEPGDTFQFVLPTPDSIRTAVEEAKRMQGYCTGVVFFKWPGFNDTLAAQPNEALDAAGVMKEPQKPTGELRTLDGECVAVSCTDLYLMNASPLYPNTMRHRIHSSAQLEYFLPKEKMPIRMSGASEMELVLPPFCAQTRMYLGRAVTSKHSDFTLEQLP